MNVKQLRRFIQDLDEDMPVVCGYDDASEYVSDVFGTGIEKRRLVDVPPGSEPVVTDVLVLYYSGSGLTWEDPKPEEMAS